ncbi:MAG: diguanylate cyclase [Gemmatimonadaceae bacterium]
MNSMLATAQRAQHLRLVERPDSSASSDQLIEEARALDKLGRRAEARAGYEKALRAMANPSPSMASTLMRWIARTYEVDADYVAAEDCATAAVATAELGDDRTALGHALNVLAAVRWRQGDLDHAESLFHEALERGTSTTDPRLRVDVMTNLGTMASIRGDFREALRCFEHALAQGRLHSLLDTIVIALNNLGLANMALGRNDEAEDAFTEALTIANALGGLSTRVQLEVNAASLQIQKGDYAEATRRCDRAMALVQHLDDDRANGEASKVYGVIARDTGDLVAAEAHLTTAREIAARTKDFALEADTSRELAELYGRLGRNRETLQAMSRSHACFTQLRSRHELADVGRRMSRLEGDFLTVVKKWGESIESKDVNTQGHCERVAEIAGTLAKRAGLDETSLFWFRIGAMLHDVGKLIVPAEVLNKQGKLTEDEWALMRQHPAAGEQMLADVEFPWDVGPMVRSHHERWDGRGYPDGLESENIPLSARILCIADVYDALTAERGYKRAFSQLEAIEIMRREVGRQFDPQLFAYFEELVRHGTITTQASTRRVVAVAPRRSGSISAVAASEEDDLTGALVRRAFENVTSAVLVERRRTGAAVSLLVIDVDHFKSVNDTFGHLAGDEALRVVAGVVREQLRAGQYVGRYAGDEFVVLLPGLDAARAGAFANKVRATVAQLAIPLRDEPERTMSVSLSIGVATAPENGETFEALFTTADRALFDAKRGGRDRVEIAGAPSDAPTQLAFGRFVGRERELRKLVLALDESVYGSPQTRFVLGEAGVGKSSLVRQLLPELRLRGAVIATGRAIEGGSQLPFRPWTEVLTALHELGLTPSRGFPLLAQLVPVLRSNAHHAASGAARDPLHAHWVMEELSAFLREASASRPLLIVLEDMHWSDTASWDALDHVLAALTSERICIALTVRNEEAMTGAVRERRQRLSRDERVRELQLERLTSREVKEWLCGALHRSSLGDDLLDFVLRHTEGNAFLMVQLLRTMEEEGVFKFSGTTWEWTIPSALSLPAGMTDLVGRRLSRLSPEALRVLVTAATLGRTFALPLLMEAAGTTKDMVLDAIDAGLATSVLELAPDQDDETYQFAHALLVDSVLKSVSAARRKLTHERIAEILVQRSPEAVDRIARHWASSSNSAQAYEWSRRAASHAMTMYALDEATEHLEHALSHARSDDERAAAREELARAAEQSGRWADAEASCDEILKTPSYARDIAKALPIKLRRLQARVRLGHSAADTEAECRDLLVVAERTHAVADIVQTRSLLVQTLARVGKIDDAIAIAEGSLTIAEDSNDPGLADEAMHRLAITLLGSRAEEAVDLLLRLIGRAQTRDDRVMQARAYLSLGVARVRTRDDAAGVDSFRSALSMARDAQALDVAASASMNLGVIGLRGGDFQSARDGLNDALRLYTTLRNDANRLAALYNLANLALERGETEEASTLYAETASIAKGLGASDILVGAYSGQGLLAIKLSDPIGARSAQAAAHAALGARQDWWFQGRQLFESLNIRLGALDGHEDAAEARFLESTERLEAMDVYAAAWMVADCAAELINPVDAVWEHVERLAEHPAVEQFVPLAARFTALRDIAERRRTSHLRTAD